MTAALGRLLEPARSTGAAAGLLPLYVIGLSLLGALVAVAPALALVAAGTGLAAALLSTVGRLPVAVVVLGGALAVTAVVDLPRRFVLGGTTSYAWLTVLVALVLAAVAVTGYVGSAVRPEAATLVPLAAFAAWTVVSLAWSDSRFAGLQNVLVYCAFAAVVAVAAAAVARGDLGPRPLSRMLTVTILAGCLLYAVSLAQGGLGGEGVIGSRSFALLAVVGVAWGAAHVRLGDVRYAFLVGLCLVLVGLSLSRLAFGAAVAIVALACLDLRTPARTVRSALLLAVLAATGFFAVTSFGPLANRFSEGDVRPIAGGVSINVEGRFFYWRATWDSFLGSPLVGRGAGSAEEAILRASGEESHPHNDFLRLLHDGGALGLALFLAAIAALFLRVGRAARSSRGDPFAAIHVAAILSLVGLLAAMSTDNAVVYLFVVVPIGVLVGASVGAAGRDRDSRAATGGASR